jgi:mono/diheme cytochrome c family protein
LHFTSHFLRTSAAHILSPYLPAGSLPASLVSADPIVLKGHALFQSQSCNSCHGEGGIGTAAAVPLTGVGVKYSESQLKALLHAPDSKLLHAPDSKMTAGGMQPVGLKPQDLEALSTYLRQLH